MKDLIEVGASAPDFTLAADDGRQYHLQDLITKGPVLLVFYPANNTPGCNRQLSVVRDEKAVYAKAGVQPFGVNPASVDAHRKFVEKMNFNFPILSDAAREVAGAYGALKEDEKGIQRSVVLVGKKGTVLFAARGAPGPTEILAALERGTS